MRINHRASQAVKDKAEVERDTLLSQLKELTPEQAGQWVETNVTDLPSAKRALKGMAMVIVYLLRRGL